MSVSVSVCVSVCVSVGSGGGGGLRGSRRFCGQQDLFLVEHCRNLGFSPVGWAGLEGGVSAHSLQSRCALSAGLLLRGSCCVACTVALPPCPTAAPAKSLCCCWCCCCRAQGKIKGSYTPDKMLDFCRRGTLSSSQLLLGIDQNLPYLARQVCACMYMHGPCVCVCRGTCSREYDESEVGAAGSTVDMPAAP